MAANFQWSITVFFDILGYKEMAKSAAAAADGGVEFLNRLVDGLSAAQAEVRDWTGEDARWTSFTDCVVVGLPIFQDGEGTLGNALLMCAYVQLELVRRGFFVRGGVDAGMLHMDDVAVFGQSLVAAYEAESIVAVYPRIVLTQNACNLMDRHLKSYGRIAHSPQNRSILCDRDDVRFVDYLSTAAWDEDGGQLHLDTIREHKHVVETGLRLHRKRRRVWDKFAWAATYHNSVVKRWGSEGMVEECSISAELLEWTPTTLADLAAEEFKSSSILEDIDDID